MVLAQRCEVLCCCVSAGAERLDVVFLAGPGLSVAVWEGAGAVAELDVFLELVGDFVGAAGERLVEVDDRFEGDLDVGVGAPGCDLGLGE